MRRISVKTLMAGVLAFGLSGYGMFGVNGPHVATSTTHQRAEKGNAGAKQVPLGTLAKMGDLQKDVLGAEF